jgi:hypothetical protein
VGESGLEAEDFRELGAYQCYAQLVAEIAPQRWTSAQTTLPPDRLNDPTAVRADSLRRYGAPRREIEASLERLARDPTCRGRPRPAVKHREIALQTREFQNIDAVPVGPAGQAPILVDAAAPSSGSAISHSRSRPITQRAARASAPWGAPQRQRELEARRLRRPQRDLGTACSRRPTGQPRPRRRRQRDARLDVQRRQPQQHLGVYLITTSVLLLF